MKRLLLLCLISALNAKAQHCMQVFDQYGNPHPATDLIMPSTAVPYDNGSTAPGPTIFQSYGSGTPSGYFQIWIAPTSGFAASASTTSAQAQARLVVIDQLLKDLSAFINSPLSSSPYTPKVNILLDDIGSPAPVSSGTVGVGYSFYHVPNLTSNSSALSGVLDNSVWRTIKTGQDAYLSTDYPLVSPPVPIALTGQKPMIHAVLRINFPAYTFNTDSSRSPYSNEYDLYSVALHEITHALGFGSMISKTGASNINSSSSGGAWKFFSRYDLKLKTHATTLQASQPLIITDPSCIGYGATFNPAILSASGAYNFKGNLGILEPNTSTTCTADNTVCGTAIQYVGSITEAVYTPDCFTDGSSLSHFEDQCLSPSNNNGYFVMSNLTPIGTSKRYLKPEERAVLCDIGYSVNTSFGNTTYLNFYNYGGSGCAGLGVAGVNDGAKDGYYQYITNLGEQITISDALKNDIGADRMDCLEIVLGTGTLKNVSAKRFTYVPTITPGGNEVHVLRYLPAKSATGEQGNITYIFIKVLTSNCTYCPQTTSNPSIISNGDFESSAPVATCGTLVHTIYTTAPYLNCWTDYNSSANPTAAGPGATYGPELKVVGAGGTCSGTTPNNTGTFNYLNLDAATNVTQQKVLLQNVLTKPLIPGGQYQLKFYARCPQGVCPTPGYSNQLIILGEEALAVPQYLNPGFDDLPPATLSQPLGPGTGTGPGIIDIQPSAGWVPYTYSFTVPTLNGKQQFPYILIGAYSGNFDFDDVSITPVSVTYPLFSTASTLLAYYGASTTHVITTNNKIQISGSFTIDADLNLKACPNVVCDPNSDMTIQAGKTLSITDGTVVFAGCDNTWLGIKTTASTNPSHIIIDQSDIHDMQDGVLVAGTTSISCTDSKFIDNIIGIDFLGTPMGYTDLVDNNEFYKDRWRGDVGIRIRECNAVQVGNLTDGNSFHHLNTGIDIEQSGNPSSFSNAHLFELYNNDFHDIRGGQLTATYPFLSTATNSNREGAAIYGNSVNGYRFVPANTNIVVVNYSNTAKFRNCDKGIYLKGYFSANIENTDMDGGWGIYCDATEVQHHSIRNNKITNAVCGIMVHGSHSDAHVAKNNISINPISLFAPSGAKGAFNGAKGIEVTDYPFPKLSRSNIARVDTNVVAYYSGSGAAINLLTPALQTSANWNTINLLSPTLSPIAFSYVDGINLQNGPRAGVSQNTITASIPYGNPNKISVAGIAMVNSSFCSLSCNTSKGTGNGLHVIGNCVTGDQSITLNVFENDAIDMLFRHNGVEGSLGDIGRASVSGTPFDCKNNFKNIYSSHYNLYRLSTCPSTFAPVDNIYTYSPLPTSGATGGCKYQTITNNGATRASNCAISAGGPVITPLTSGAFLAMARGVATGTASYSEYAAGATWLEELGLYRLLREEPDLLNDSVLNVFYGNKASTAIDDVEQVNSLIAAIDTASDSTSFALAWQSAESANTALSTPTQQLSNEQAINAIYLKYMIGGTDTLSAEDVNTIASLALQCPLVGGAAVYKARSLYTHYQPLINYNDIGLCNYPDPNDTTNGIYDGEEVWLASVPFDTTNGGGHEGGGSSGRMTPQAYAAQAAAASLQLYPNPVGGELRIDYPEGGRLEIYDVTNRHLKSVTLGNAKGGQAAVDMHGIAPGICICRYYVDGKLRAVKKITVQHD